MLVEAFQDGAGEATLNAYGKGLALARGPHGVRVTAVMPGVIETAVETACGRRRSAPAATRTQSA
ncbi:hypothetical protein ACIGXM_16010 [Kitasatospora sp. NPDC052896]|uniref:hypothetical protein n=1 Tax=Kitasatospora sp. NPDC052896 TaxID=3364061 RepID=UPI0037C8308E